MGDMAEMYDDWEDDEEGVECKHCHTKGLEWIHTGERWRLFDDEGKPHICKPKVSVDEFQDVS